MRMKKIRENKRGLSEIVSYVLLILIAFGLGTLIFVWLKDITTDKETEVCPPEGVSISIKNSVCDDSAETVTLTIRNAGRFNIDGLIVKGSNNPDAEAWADLTENDDKLYPSGIFNIIQGSSGENSPLAPNTEGTYKFEYSGLGSLAKILVGAARSEDNDLLVCTESYISQEVECT